MQFQDSSPQGVSPGTCFPQGRVRGTTLSQRSPWRTERTPVRLTNHFGCCSLLRVLLLTSPLPHSVECNKIKTLHRKHKVEIKKKQVCTLLKIHKLLCYAECKHTSGKPKITFGGPRVTFDVPEVNLGGPEVTFDQRAVGTEGVGGIFSDTIKMN